MSDSIPTRSRTLVKQREHLRCARCGSGRAGSWHHRRSRRVRAAHQHCPCNGVWLCDFTPNSCHRWVHAHPALAKEEGFIVSQFEDSPGEVTVQLWDGGRWTLDCDGGAVCVAAKQVH